MGCHYCNNWAGKSLGSVAVCEDCYQTSKYAPEEARAAVIIERLQKLHAKLIKHPQQGYLKTWVIDIAERLKYLLQDTSNNAEPIPVSKPSVKVSTKPKKLIIRKFR